MECFLLDPAQTETLQNRIRQMVAESILAGLLQRAAAHFLSLGHNDAMLLRLTRVFSQCRAVMLEAVHAPALAAALREDSVLIEPGGPFFAAPEAGKQFYRIAYSSITAERIPEGIARIARQSHRMASPRIGSPAR